MTPPLPADTEHERNRLNERRLAKLAAVVVLVAAVITSGSAIGGAWLGAHIQGDANEAQNDRQFQNSQQLTIYAKFVNQVGSDYKLITDTYGYAYQNEHIAGSDDPRLKQLQDKYQKAIDQVLAAGDDMQQTIDEIKIIGSRTALTKAMACREALSDSFRKINAAVTDGTDYDVATKYAHAKVFPALDAFIKVARDDVHN